MYIYVYMKETFKYELDLWSGSKNIVIIIDKMVL